MLVKNEILDCIAVMEIFYEKKIQILNIFEEKNEGRKCPQVKV